MKPRTGAPNRGETGTLYVCATPIGNLKDITLRALEVLRSVAAVAAEDTRRTRKLLAHYGIRVPVISCHEHNWRQAIPRIIALLQEGKSVALVSDAGMPGISDPGADVVAAVLRNGLQVRSVPGPSSVTAALAVSGLPASSFFFQGFLPRRRSARRARLEWLRQLGCTVVLYVSPHRFEEVMDDICRVMGEHVQAAWCREITKMHEEILRGTVGQLRDRVRSALVRGEITLVLGAAEPKVSEEELDPLQVAVAVEQVRASGCSPTRAAKQVAERLGIPRRIAYYSWLRHVAHQSQHEEE